MVRNTHGVTCFTAPVAQLQPAITVPLGITMRDAVPSQGALLGPRSTAHRHRSSCSSKLKCLPAERTAQRDMFS
eukprot:5489658-Pyramimonas_sp.AAC.1